MTAPVMVSAGYVVTRLAPRPTYVDAALLPPQLISASDCIAEFFPSFWALREARVSEQDRAAAAAKFGITPHDLPKVIEYMTRARDRQELGWPRVWFSTQSAIAAIKRFLSVLDDVVLVGLGVPQDLADDFLAGAGPMDTSDICTMLRAGNPLASGGTPLGWEVVGYEFGGDFHSWLCNHIEKEAYARLGIRPGANGLIVCENDARSILSLVGLDDVGAEPVPWFPLLFVQYNIE